MDSSIGLGIFLLFLVVCVIMGTYFVFNFQTTTNRKTKRSRSTTKEQQTARDQVARFYGPQSLVTSTAASCFRPGPGKSTDTCLETAKLIDKTSGPKTGFVCGSQIPPLYNTVACTIQPTSETIIHKQRLTRALSEDYQVNQYRLKHDGSSHMNRLPKLSEPNLNKHGYPLRGSISFSSRTLQSSQESVTLSYGRRSSIEKLIDPMIKMFSATTLRSQYSEEENWTNVSPSLNGVGQICFSLCYTCTFGLLNVTINRLSGVTYLSRSESTLPSQVMHSFVVGLRIRQLNNQIKSEMNEVTNKTFFTQPISTSHNPNFDQSFSFKISSGDLDRTELVFTVLITTLSIKNPDNIERRRTQFAASLYYPYSQRPQMKKLVSEEMRCIGVAFYKLNRHELINSCEKLQNIWQELQKLPDLDEIKPPEEEEIHTLPTIEMVEYKNEDTGVKSNTLTEKETSPNKNEPSVYGSNEINISMIYTKSTSTLQIQLNEVRGSKIRKNDVRLFIRATLCSGTKRLSSSQSNYTKITKSDETKSPNKSSSVEESFANSFRPHGESISFSIELQHLIHDSNLGIHLYLYARNRIGLTRRLGRCYFGTKEFTDAAESEHWSRLIKSVKQLQCDPYTNTIDPISYWHVLMN